LISGNLSHLEEKRFVPVQRNLTLKKPIQEEIKVEYSITSHLEKHILIFAKQTIE